MCWHPAMDALVDQVVPVQDLSSYEPGAIVVHDRQMRKWMWPKGAFDLVAPVVVACASLDSQAQEEKEPNMPSIPASVAPASAPSRNRSAVNEALRRAPVEWSLDEAHEMIVKLAVGTVKVRAHKPIIKAWVEEQLQSEYGKALLGVVVGNVAPLVAPHLGRGEQLVQRVSDELLAVSYKKAMVRAARDLKKVGGPLLKMGMKLFATLFDRVEDAERMREVAALGAGSEGSGLFAEAAVSDKMPAAAQR